jgi:hypothetical protein
MQMSVYMHVQCTINLSKQNMLYLFVYCENIEIPWHDMLLLENS